ncbi:MAG: hypothetical protein LBL87_06625 [Ruminococcus sp.]|jgi:hypothetical protein|nr:hypothetical protein [Ruminococcus sp.]
MQNFSDIDLKKAFGEYKRKAEDNADFLIVGLLTLIALLLLINVCIEATKLRRVKSLNSQIDYLTDLEDDYCECGDYDDCDLDFNLEELSDADKSQINMN